MQKKRISTFAIIVICILAAAAIAAAAAGYRYLHRKDAAASADAVVQSMKQIIPGLGTETDIDMGDGKDPLSVMTVDGMDVVGCLEIPSIGIMTPVTAKDKGADGFASYESGSAVKGKLMLTGNKADVFSDIASLKPGDKAVFTDVDGVRYRYRVLTQFHLKKWDEADYDLMLYYNTDSKTRFVVGLNRDPN